jgi:hypothetical protein
MPLPLIPLAIAGAAGLGGVIAGIRGGVKMKDASDTMSLAKSRHERNVEKLESANLSTTNSMDNLGKFEMEVLKSFKEFSDTWEKIHNRPDFKNIKADKVDVQAYTAQELNDVSVGAGVLLGGLGGAAVGTAGGFAAAGATTAAVMAVGTAGTGTAISSLSGAAATNAVLALLGGGTLAAGGGGVALGTMVLGAATLGVGLLVGGIIFSITGSSLSDKADEAWAKMKEEEGIINDVVAYLDDLRTTAENYLDALHKAGGHYVEGLLSLQTTTESKTDWKEFTADERLNAENTALLVGLLYEMCKVKIVIDSENESDKKTINKKDIEAALGKATAFLG